MIALLTVAAIAVLPPGVGVDYQLGGAYPLPSGVGIVSRDWREQPAAGAFNICYINGFQAQPEMLRWWRREHPDLLLPVKDAAWNEVLLDTRRPNALARVANRWIRTCARKGFDAVEADNLDSWTRSAGMLTRRDNVRYARLLIKRAHAAGLAIAQKNTAGLAHRKLFDFAVVEECQRYKECGHFRAAYGDQVIEIEYRRRDFEAACAARSIPIVLRDRLLRTPGKAGYVYAAC